MKIADILEIAKEENHLCRANPHRMEAKLREIMELMPDIIRFLDSGEYVYENQGLIAQLKKWIDE